MNMVRIYKDAMEMTIIFVRVAYCDQNKID